ncbi:MAG: C-GCAxxG-C-C family protein, partial [Clostridiales bacterium]|nr:C-GCAxxG-C-C family protein [Clostridiales bacterium]
RADGFGGGMGRLRLTCGAVSGMTMLAGLRYSSGKPGDLDNRTQVYSAVQKMAALFEEKHGSVICRELLGASAAARDPRPEARTAEYYKKRPCPEMIAECADIAAEVLFGEEAE